MDLPVVVALARHRRRGINEYDTIVAIGAAISHRAGGYNTRRAERASMNELVEAARAMCTKAYAPYSEYRVGAAIETPDGSVYTGCNVENANYSNSLHAEEVAVADAFVDGQREFVRLAVSSSRRDGVTPCGMCRQTLAEFCDDDLVVLCDEGDGETSRYTLGELLPNTITREMVERVEGSDDDS